MSSVIIPARYASTRFPAKVLADIMGEPMIVKVAKQALKSKADKVYVATDSEKVIDVCKGIKNLEAILTPAELASGSDRVAYVAKELNDDIIINVQGDEPFIPPALIDSLIDGLINDKSLNMITAKTLFNGEEGVKNPNAVKVVTDNFGNALYFSRSQIPFNRDENLVKYYRHIGIYGFRRSFLLEFTKLSRTPLEVAENLEQLRALENGVKINVVETDYNPMSVDTKEDLEEILLYLKR